MHPYAVPEILAVPVLAGNQSYLHWIGTSTGAGELGDSTALV
ncbi:MAG: divalent cation tolerance protein CutA [Anaerolineaceae bacterium]|nr:divalent cation tolerance protein CutA [Anaerolineaceae bacterium]